jgi:anti-anti-sigma factor
MHISDHAYKHCHLLKIDGRIDSDTSPEFEEKLDALFKDKSHKIVLDMSGVEFISSAGLRVLISGRKTARAAKGDIRLAAVTDKIKRSFELVGFDKLFESYDTVVDGVGSF